MGGSRRSRQNMFLLAAGLCCVVQVCQAQGGNSQAELARLEESIALVEQWLEQANRSRPAHEQRLQAIEQQVAALDQSMAATRAVIADNQAELGHLQEESAGLALSVGEQEALVDRILRAAYMEGRANYFKLLLGQDDPALATRMLYYYRVLNRDRLAGLQAFRNLLDQTEANRRQLAATQAVLDAEQAALATQLEDLQRAREERQATLAALDEEIGQRGSEREKLLADREALDTLVEEAVLAVEGFPPPGSRLPFSGQKGSLPWPGQGGLRTRFGERYGNGELQYQGITIAAEAGAPVRAVHAGRVVFANWLRGAGLLLIIDHGDGYLSLYGSNQRLDREAGAAVEAGEVIALAGDSGGRDESGIYFEIRYNGRPQNPMDWLRPPG